MKFSVRLYSNPYRKLSNKLERALISIDRQLFPLSEKLVLSGAEWVWFARYGDDIAGYGVMTSTNSRAGALTRCGVIPRYRGNKLQQKLIKARERYAAKHLEWFRLTAYASEDNIASILSLERCGFLRKENKAGFIRLYKELGHD